MSDPTLIADLEAATGPSRELDARIKRAITPELADTFTAAKCGCGEGWLAGGDHPNPTFAPPYTESIDAALLLVPDDWTYWLYRRDLTFKLTPLAQVYNPRSFRSTETEAATLPLAICIAALKARSEDV